jgi:hypothetical protein
MANFTVNGRAYQPIAGADCRHLPGRIGGRIFRHGYGARTDAESSASQRPGLSRPGAGAMPSLTNVNNAFHCDRRIRRAFMESSATIFSTRPVGKEVMMNSAVFLRAETIFPAAQRPDGGLRW